jgi:molybdenum cofactor cytidylyltransferase
MDMVNSKPAIGIVVLAAGGSRRMEGEPKQLLEFAGRSLVRRAAETALAVAPGSVCVVLGACAEISRAEIAGLPLEIAVNPNWQQGIGSSIRTGIARLLEFTPDVDAAIIMLCDQPLITPTVVQRLIDSYAQTLAPVVVAEYEGTVGVPALFSSALFGKLLELSGDSGAKTIIRNSPVVEKVSVPEAALDIDTKQDRQRLVLRDIAL